MIYNELRCIANGVVVAISGKADRYRGDLYSTPTGVLILTGIPMDGSVANSEESDLVVASASKLPTAVYRTLILGTVLTASEHLIDTYHRCSSALYGIMPRSIKERRLCKCCESQITTDECDESNCFDLFCSNCHEYKPAEDTIWSESGVRVGSYVSVISYPGLARVTYVDAFELIPDYGSCIGTASIDSHCGCYNVENVRPLEDFSFLKGKHVEFIMPALSRHPLAVSSNRQYLVHDASKDCFEIIDDIGHNITVYDFMVEGLGAMCSDGRNSKFLVEAII